MSKKFKEWVEKTYIQCGDQERIAELAWNGCKEEIIKELNRRMTGNPLGGYYLRLDERDLDKIEREF